MSALLTRCQRSQRQRRHCVGVVNDYAHMDKTTRTLGKLWRLLTDCKGTVRWKKVLGCVFKPNSNNLKLSLSNIFAKTKISKTVFVCSYGAQVKSFKQKIWSKISWHCPFKLSNFKMLTNLDVAECMAMIVRCWTVLNGPHMTLRRVFCVLECDNGVRCDISVELKLKKTPLLV